MMNRTWMVLAAASSIGSVTCSAEPAPLWEAGAGVAALTLPAYRGSNVSQNFVLPAPYLVYHGDFLKADRHGMRGELFANKRIEFNISVSASPPTSSDGSPWICGWGFT